MSQLRDLFHKPAPKTIGGTDFLVYKLEMQQFEDSLLVGRLIQQIDDENFQQALGALELESPQRQAIDRLVAGSLKVVATAEAPPIEMVPADVKVMPIAMLAEAVAVIVEVNVDFFLATLPKLAQISQVANRIGSALLNNSSAPATT